MTIFNTTIPIEGYLSINEQIENVNHYKHMVPEEKMYRFLLD